MSRFFCSCDLDLDPMIFIYELNPYPLKIYPQTRKKNKLSALGLSKVIVLQTIELHLTYNATRRRYYATSQLIINKVVSRDTGPIGWR